VRAEKTRTRENCDVRRLPLVAVVVLAACGGPSDADRDRAVRLAQERYAEAKQAGRELANGPCLGTLAMEGWVVDVAHDPRQPVDDESENQCHGYEHFVELDVDGRVMRVN